MTTDNKNENIERVFITDEEEIKKDIEKHNARATDEEPLIELVPEGEEIPLDVDIDIEEDWK